MGIVRKLVDRPIIALVSDLLLGRAPEFVEKVLLFTWLQFPFLSLLVACQILRFEDEIITHRRGSRQ